MPLQKRHIIWMVLSFITLSTQAFADEERFSKNLRVDNQTLQVKISKSDGSWKVLLTEKKNSKTLLTSTIPEWVASNYYDYSLASKTISKHPVILFEARPLPGLDTPKNADTLQFAWFKKDNNWKAIASTQSSLLEGSDQLQFRKEEGQLALVRLQSKSSNHFCGDRLGVYKIFRPNDGSFRTKVRLESLLENTKTVKALIPSTPFVPSIFHGFTSWSFASSKENHTQTKTLIRPDKLGDGLLKSYWSEGKANGSRGEFVTARLNNALKTKGLRIFPGIASSEENFKASSKPTKLLLSFSNGKRFTVTLPETDFNSLKTASGMLVQFPEPIASTCMSVIILESSDDSLPSSISELSPINELDGLDKKSAALVVVEKLLNSKSTSSRKLSQLTYPIRKELEGVLKSVIRDGSKTDRKRIVPLLRNLPSEAALPILIELFEELPVDDPSYRLLKPLLATHANSAEALVSLYRRETLKDPKKNLDLIRLIGRTKGSVGPSALIQSLGRGDAQVRKELVRSITKGGEKVLPELFSFAAKNPNSLQSEDALTTIIKIAKHRFRNTKGQLRNEQITSIFRASKTRRERALSANASAFFTFEGDLDFYKELFEHKDPFIRKQGALGLRNLPGQEARVALERGLNDPSPDVRIETIQAFSSRRDSEESSDALLSFVAEEQWAQALRPGCRSLAKIGTPSTFAALEKIVVENQGTKSLIAAQALIKERQSLDPQSIRTLIESQKTSPRQKIVLIEMLGVKTDFENETLLVEIISNPSKTSLDERSQTKIKQRAIFSLGRQNSRSATEAMFGLLEEEPSGSKMRKTILRAFAFQKEAWILRQLQTFEKKISAENLSVFNNSLTSIRRRIDLKKLSDSIKPNDKP